MPVVSRIAKVRIADTATGAIFREWVATAAAQDSAAGAGVDITVTQTTGGATPPATANTLVLNLYNDAGTLIRAFTLTPGSASQTVTFHFTNDGTSTGTARAGTVEIAIRATRTNVGTYDVESDGAPNDPGAGNTSTLDRGWIRGTTTATTTISNIALGGAKSAPAEYDESLFVRTTLGAALYVARALTVAISGASPALSGATNSATSGNFDATFAAVVDDRFPAAVTTVATSLSVPNATLTEQPATALTATNDSLDVDPRLDAESHLWQVDDDVIATPPMSKHDASKSALVSSFSAMGMRVVRARTRTGVDGLGYSLSLDPTNPGAVLTRPGVTATRGGQAGWTELAQLGPFVIGGGWSVALDITSPADIDADTHLLNRTDTVTILSPDPRVAVMVAFGSTTASEDDHLKAGDATAITVTAFSRDTGKRLAPDPGSVFASLVRWNRAAARFEYLAANGLTWTPWTGSTTTTDTHAMTDAGDGVTFTKALATTEAWGATDIVAVQVNVKMAGTPYGFYVGRELTGANHNHATPGGEPMVPADIASIANAVWDETTAEARAAGSYGAIVAARLDAAVSTRSSGAALTTVQGLVDDLEARLTAARALLLDNLDAAVSTRATPAQVDAAVNLSAQVDIA